METTLKIGRLLFYLAGIFALTALGFLALAVKDTAKELQTTVKDADRAAQQIAELAPEVKRRVTDTAQNLNAVLIQVGLTADEGRRASAEQRAYWAKISAETVTLLADADKILKSADTNQQRAFDDLHGISGETQSTIQAIRPIFEELRGTIQLANRQIDNPDYARAAKALADSAEHINGIADNGEKISAIAEKKFQQMTKPASLAKTVLTKLLDVAYKLKAFF